MIKFIKKFGGHILKPIFFLGGDGGAGTYTSSEYATGVHDLRIRSGHAYAYILL